MATDKPGYVNYYETLGLEPGAKPGEVRKAYRREMKALLGKIRESELTETRRNEFLLTMAELNAALALLRDVERREAYWNERSELMELEDRWRRAAEEADPGQDGLRREFDRRIKAFLAHYVDELMLDAGRDPECVEQSNWDAAHERHAAKVLRLYRQELYKQILERLPYSEVTPPGIDWTEREAQAARIIEQLQV